MIARELRDGGSCWSFLLSIDVDRATIARTSALSQFTGAGAGTIVRGLLHMAA
jgi:hypothetical protein